MGESSLERNTLKVYNACVESSTSKASCKEMAKEYAEDKAEQIQDYFDTMLKKTEIEERIPKEQRTPHSKVVEWNYRKDTAIPDALKRVKDIIDEL
nr:hypothetical protein [uncultured archaeon]